MQGFRHSRPVEEPFANDVNPEGLHQPIQDAKAGKASIVIDVAQSLLRVNHLPFQLNSRFREGGKGLL